MKEQKIEQGRLTEHAQGLGTVSEEMVMRRAGELAVIAGRSADQILSSDIEQARRELTGKEGLVREESLDRLTEDQRWEPVPESEGHKTPATAAPDEQTFAEKLVEEGVEDAEHDQMLKATQESLRREPAE